MTVEELIEKLRTFPKDAPVRVDSPECYTSHDPTPELAPMHHDGSSCPGKGCEICEEAGEPAIETVFL